MEAHLDEGLAARASALAEQLDGPQPVSWRPDVPTEAHPPVLVGTLLRVEQGHTSWGPKRIAVIRDLAGEVWSVWLLHKVLVDEFARQAPRIGELLAVKYLGKVIPERGSPYEKYRLAIDRDGNEVQWQPAAEQQQPDPPAPPPASGACSACGLRDGQHAPGCVHDIPF
jgi:hypothetical protein